MRKTLTEIRNLSAKKRFRVRDLTNNKDYLVLGYVTNNFNMMAAVSMDTGYSEKLSSQFCKYILLSSLKEMELIENAEEEPLIQTFLKLYDTDFSHRIMGGG